MAEEEDEGDVDRDARQDHLAATQGRRLLQERNFGIATKEGTRLREFSGRRQA